MGRTARAGDVQNHRLGMFEVQVGNDYRGAAFGQLNRAGGADPRSAAGDDDRLALETQVHLLFLSC